MQRNRTAVVTAAAAAAVAAAAVVVEGVDGRSIGVQYVGTWDFDRNNGQRSIIRVQGRIIVAGEEDAKVPGKSGSWEQSLKKRSKRRKTI